MCDREELTDATIRALQGQITKGIDARDEDKEQMRKIVENYSKEDNLEEFGRIFVTVTTEEELMKILRAIIDQYYNNIKSI